MHKFGGSCSLRHPQLFCRLANRRKTGQDSRPRVFAKVVPEQSEIVSEEVDWNLVWNNTCNNLLGLFVLLTPTVADAADLEAPLELFKTKPLSLIHPLVMIGVLGASLYTFYLGYQSKRVKEADAETRKILVKGRYGQRHFQTSSLLLALLTVFTFEGMANTFARTGKLFPGPHLYAGLGAVTVMSIMASLAPYMQQGKQFARDVHFALAFLVIGLMGSQVQSGYHIVARLLGWE
eukprot:jgi/Galph1/1183/GphlegSOOS_G6118.1